MEQTVMKRPYRVLAAISALYNVLGVICMLAGIGVAAYTLYDGSRLGAPLTPLLVNSGIFLVIGILSGLLLLGMGQLVRLLMDMAASARQTEQYTKATAKLLQRQMSRSGSARVAPQSSMPRSALDDLDDNSFSFLG
jgi:hypothetical protein